MDYSRVSQFLAVCRLLHINEENVLSLLSFWFRSILIVFLLWNFYFSSILNRRLDLLKLVVHGPYILNASDILGKFNFLFANLLYISFSFSDVSHGWSICFVYCYWFLTSAFAVFSSKAYILSILYNVSFCPISDMWICGLERTWCFLHRNSFSCEIQKLLKGQEVTSNYIQSV